MEVIVESRRPDCPLLVTVLEAETCVVAFEPEGATITLNKADAFTVEVSGPGDGVVEVAMTPRALPSERGAEHGPLHRDRAGKALKL